MDLEEYNKKRDFEKTPEPRGTLAMTTESHRFVVQRHSARKLHFDLRLEIGGSLKCWAIPKGPSMNPDDKRLAVRTEDHPLKYLTFHGTIPKGNYGAGEMVIWDSGTFEVDRSELDADAGEQLAQGNLKLIFTGENLQGQFGLISTGPGNGKESWLFIKKQDEFATDLHYSAEDLLPGSSSGRAPGQPICIGKVISPMLASTGQKVFNDPDWIYELKWDGYRVLAHISENGVLLQSRNGISLNTKFPELVKELEETRNEAILDGEVVLLNKDGVPQFGELQNYPDSSGTLAYYIFDMLYLNGHVMVSLPLLDRKSLIAMVIEGMRVSRYCDHVEVLGSALFEKATRAGMEGIMAKLATSEYTPGFRTENWLKIKSIQSMDALICGYTDSVNGGAAFGSLILGDSGAGRLRYLGNCGSGFSEGDRQRLLSMFRPYETDRNPFGKSIALKGRHPNWLLPVVRCEVKFSEQTKNGLLRNPVFKRIINSPRGAEPGHHSGKPGKTAANSETVEIDGVSVPVSNLEKVLWPESGYTKYDLIDYYLAMADFMLPHLADRPQNLHRHPDGIHSEGFYQKDNEHLPEWIKTVKIYSKSSQRELTYLLCQDTATLVYMANLGCIEINPWNSRIGQLEFPDYGVVDLDPPAGMSFDVVVKVAKAFGDLFEKAGITGYCKTSGSKGIHIYIPCGGAYSYEEVRNFIKLLCHLVQDRLPDSTTMERKVADRNGELYLDYLQNRKGHTVASVYAVRPRPGATVSTPIAWHELKKGLAITDFTIKNLPRRIRAKGDLFAPIHGASLNMEEVLGLMDEMEGK